MTVRPAARLSLACNNRCVFCSQDGLSGERSLEEQLEAARRAGSEVTFVGGEPTLDARLPEHVVAARAMGFARIGLQTNGRRLAEVGLAASLARAGLTDVHLSVHGTEAAVHDYHTGVEGSFDAALAGLAAARASGLAVVVATVLTRSNFRSLSGLPKMLASRGVAGWMVAAPACGGRLAREFDRLMPRLGLALPFALKALAAGEALGLDVWISGVPRCLVGPYGRWLLPELPRSFGAACNDCPARSACPGLDAAYLGRFGGDELGPARARMAAPIEPQTRDLRTARMFVGPGEIAAALPVAEKRPASAKVSLPMAGKVRPAVAEATAGSPRRSGEALREIFPELFDGGGSPPREGRG